LAWDLLRFPCFLRRPSSGGRSLHNPKARLAI
jgi:hypothetical protein